MSARTYQPALFAVLGVGEHVKVFTEGGDYETSGVVRSIIWRNGEPRTVAVARYEGGVIIRVAARVVVNEDVWGLL